MMRTRTSMLVASRGQLRRILLGPAAAAAAAAAAALSASSTTTSFFCCHALLDPMPLQHRHGASAKDSRSYRTVTSHSPWSNTNVMKTRTMEKTSRRRPLLLRSVSTNADSATIIEDDYDEGTAGEWSDVLPMEKGSHGSARIVVPSRAAQREQEDAGKDGGEDGSGSCRDDPFRDGDVFRDRLGATITACREMNKSSLWMEVPMDRCGLVEHAVQYGFKFHHAVGETAVLNVWLRDGVESKIPEFATHNVGVGAVVVNSRDEILLVRELRRNYMPWKTPTGLSELGEQIGDAAEREVLEETGVPAKFHSLLSFRQTHGLAHGRSDLFFVCRLDPIEGVDEASGGVVVPEPVPQENEIERAEWVPLTEYRKMVSGDNDPYGKGHPMMSHVLDVFDAGRLIEQTVVGSVVPGREPNTVYYPSVTDNGNDD